MAVLERMFIRGVRSFGPTEEEKVKFSTPITLFLGQNGSGKTTVIECIKYALCGDLPSNSDNGSGFVNDPKLSNKSSTKASIKLKFRDLKGDYITVGRFLEVSTLANNKLRFKSINPSIRWEDGHKIKDPEDINGRCADINLYCAQKLNVSKVILNNVIFCHQENSAWALEEDKKVKEKFDEIFGAAEYNKCVDNLRSIIKMKNSKLAVLKAELEGKLITKKYVESKRNQLAANQEELQEVEDIIHEETNKLKPLEDRLKEIRNIESVIAELQQELIGLEKTLDSAKKHENDLKKYMDEEFTGTTEELENEIKNFETNQDGIQKAVQEIETKISDNKRIIIELNTKLPLLQENHARIQAEQEQQSKRHQEMGELLEDAKKRFKITNSIETADVIAEIESSIKKQEDIFERLKQKKNSQEKSLQTKIDKIRDKFAHAKSSVSSMDQAIAKNLKEIEELTPKYNELKMVEGQNKFVEDKIKELRETVENKTKEFKETEIKTEIRKIDEEVAAKEKSQIELDKLYKTLNMNYANEQSIAHEKSSVTKKQMNVDEIKKKHNQYFKLLFKNNDPKSNYENSVRKILKTESDKLKTYTVNISKCEKNVISLETNAKHLKEKICSYEDELKTKENKINNFCKGNNFSNVLQQSYKKKKKLEKEKGSCSSAKAFFERYVNEFEKEAPCCPVCETNFSENKSSVGKIIKKLKQKIEDLPNKLVSIENDLKKEEEFYNNIQQLKPVHDDLKVLKQDKIPNLEKKLQEITEQLDEAQLELTSLKTEKNEPEKLVDACNKVIADITLLDHCIDDIKLSENSILKLATNLEPVPNCKTLEDVEVEKSRLQLEISNLKRRSQSRKECCDNQKKQIQSMTEELQHQVQKNLEKQKLLQEKPILSQRIKECNQAIVTLKKEKKTANEQVISLEEELQEAETSRDLVLRQITVSIEEKRSEVERYNRVLNDIQKLQDKIEDYSQQNNEQKLKVIMAAIEKVKTEIQEYENMHKTMNANLISKKEDLAAQENNLRKLQDNFRLRENRSTIVELETKMASVNQQIGSNNYTALSKEKKKIVEEVETKGKYISEKEGEKSKLKNFITDAQKELNSKTYREAFKQFNQKYYEIKANNLMIEDLETYTEALENSILQFHQERMVQINMIIRDLWRSIYKGNDIDYIEIKACDEVGRGKKRKYEYKVVQVKKGVELEMRGRCSAGQRVLACLVIRLALAETFSANCGILALDEPTTNLDRDNIGSLCDALSKIISAREKQKNFQLLIITHDEEFLQMLTREQSASHYYKVERNPDGFSKIELKAF